MSCVSSAGLFVRINLFRKFIFCKNVHADFYGLSDIDYVMTDFDPNKNSKIQLDEKQESLKKCENLGFGDGFKIAREGAVYG